MKFEVLPQTPKIWSDFFRSGLPNLRLPSGVEALAAHAVSVRGRPAADSIRIPAGGETDPRVSENLRRLRRPDTVVVVAEVFAGLFGGPVSQILKCLTAVKICDELAQHSVAAVPVAWVSPEAPPDFPKWSAGLIDGDGEIQTLEISAGELIPEEISALVSKTGDIGRGLFDPDVLGTLEDAFVPGRSISSACAHLVSAQMRERGLIVLDPDAPECRAAVSDAVARARTPEIASLLQREAEYLAGKGYVDPFPDTVIPAPLIQSSVLPVLACVTGPGGVHQLAKALPAFDEIGLPRPLAWPQARATVGDARSRRTLSRYDLDLLELFSGEEEVMRGIRDAWPREASGKLQGIKREVESRIGELKALLPAGDRFSRAADSSRERITYQLSKLQRRQEAALNRKEQTARCRVHTACNLLAPRRRLQEETLAWIQIPLSFSGSGLRRLDEKLDVLSFEHQLIWMD